MVTPLPPSRGPSQRAEAWAGPATRPYSQRSTGRRGGPAEGARRTRPSWRPSGPAGAGSSARSGGWRCCSGCGCSRSPSGRRRSALGTSTDLPCKRVPLLPAGSGPGLSPAAFSSTRTRHRTNAQDVPSAVPGTGDRARDRRLHRGAHSAEGEPPPRHKAAQRGAPEGGHREARLSRRSGRGRHLGLPPGPDRTSPREPHAHRCA